MTPTLLAPFDNLENHPPARLGVVEDVDFAGGGGDFGGLGFIKLCGPMSLVEPTSLVVSVMLVVVSVVVVVVLVLVLVVAVVAIMLGFNNGDDVGIVGS